MKYLDKRTGLIIKPNSDFVKKQMEKSPFYAPYQEKSIPAADAHDEEEPSGEDGETPLERLNKADLEALAKERGLEIPSRATKAEIIEILTADKE